MSSSRGMAWLYHGMASSFFSKLRKSPIDAEVVVPGRQVLLVILNLRIALDELAPQNHRLIQVVLGFLPIVQVCISNRQIGVAAGQVLEAEWRFGLLIGQLLAQGQG